MKYIHVGCALVAALFLASCSSTGSGSMKSYDPAGSSTTTSASSAPSGPSAPSTPSSPSTGKAPSGMGYGFDGVGAGGRKNPDHQPGDVVAR